jgi:hypothetical protein
VNNPEDQDIFAVQTVHDYVIAYSERAYAKPQISSYPTYVGIPGDHQETIGDRIDPLVGNR